MMDPAARLAAALRAEDAPASDPMFRIDTMIRRERSAARRQMLAVGIMVLAVAILAAIGAGAVDWLLGGPKLPKTVQFATTTLAVLLAAVHGSAAPLSHALISRCRVAARPALERIPGLQEWY